MKMDIVVMAAHISFAVFIFVLAAKKNKRITEAADLYLPDECWESIFEFLINDGSNRHICSKRLKCLKRLCLVSKQFLSVTNRFDRLWRTDRDCYMCSIECVEKLDEILRKLAAAYDSGNRRLPEVVIRIGIKY
jgi:hypothetical protein